MVFLILMGVLLLGVAFFHYIEGFFSATLSAMIIVIASVMAFSWHEVVVEKLLKGSMGNFAHGVTLLVLFCVFYVVLRMIFDKAIPAGVRMPAIAEKLGAGIMGLVAGAFAIGLLAVAAQEMPFDTDIGGYARYAVQDRHAFIFRGQRNLDTSTYDELRSTDPGQFAESDRNSAYVDDLFMGTVRYLSEQGSLQGDQKLTAFHPDYLQELFGQRVGIQPGTIRVANNLPGKEAAMKLEAIYALPSVYMFDFYPDKLRDTPLHNKWMGPLPAPEGQQAGVKFDRKNEMFVIVRMIFNRAASEKADNLIRLSCGTVRLVAQQKDATGELAPVNYYPWGTVEYGNVLFMNKPDDYLLATMADAEARAIDFAFVVQKDGFLSDPKAANPKISDGVFVEYKRMDREDLSGKAIAAAAPDLKGIPLGLMHPPPRPGDPRPPGAPALGPNGQPIQPPPPPRTPTPAPAPPQNTAPKPPTNNAARGSMTSAQQNVAAIGGKIFNYQSISKSSVLPTAVAVPQADIDKLAITVDATGVDYAHLKDKKFDKLSINPKVSTAKLGTGDFKTPDLSVPDGMVMYQITSAQPSEPWVWAQKAATFRLRTSDNKQLSPNGIWAIIKEGGEDRLIARYTSDDVISDALTAGTGTPSQITLAFLLPQNVMPKELTVDDQIVKDVSAEPIK
jgi:hypothetical protein